MLSIATFDDVLGTGPIDRVARPGPRGLPVRECCLPWRFA